MVAFVEWPIVRKYSEDGKLEEEYKIKDKIMEKAKKFNLSQQKPQPKGQPSRSRPVIRPF